jgi:hypothetical protein
VLACLVSESVSDLDIDINRLARGVVDAATELGAGRTWSW